MSQEHKLKRLRSNWRDINMVTRSHYILQNLNKADCSFLVKDASNENSQKILKSFKWILSDISPYFKKMFEGNSNCNEIPIDDPCFEDFLIYFHTQTLKTVPFELLLDMHERSKIYELPDLNAIIWNKIIWMIQDRTTVKTKWIYFFELVYRKKLKIPKLEKEIRLALTGFIGEEFKKIIEMSMDRIVKFDVDLFISLITIMSGDGMYGFFNGPLAERSFILQTIETYVEKNPSFEENIKSGNVDKSVLISILQINQKSNWIDLEKFKDYPKITELLK